MAVSANSAPIGAAASILRSLRTAQQSWTRTPVRERLAAVRQMRYLLARRAESFAQSIGRPPAETLSAEVLPLAEACRFLEVNAERLLKPRGERRGSPIWLRSVRLTIYREPHGVVLIIGPGNYPLFLPGVQLLQALTAGNAVALKPGRDGSTAAAMLVACAREAGVPRELIHLMDEPPEAAQELIRGGVDKVVLTGSCDTGKAVLEALAPRLTPCVMELSGEDPVFVLPGADLRLTAEAIRFGVTLNQGNTCIRPRRLFADANTLDRLRGELGSAADQLDFIAVGSEGEALAKASASRYALGATVFGEPQRAQAFAALIRAGVVVINDMIVPTAHPALPFGGRGASGFGITRGAEGLLEFTTVKAVALQRSRWLPHLQPAQPGDAPMFAAFLRLLHGGSLSERMSAGRGLARALLRRRKET